MRTVIFHRLAGLEYRQARRWYRQRSAWAADEFRDEVGRALERIAANAELGSQGIFGSRWVRVRRFDYVLYYYIVDDQTVRVVSVAHTSRKPGYWRRRLQNP